MGDALVAPVLPYVPEGDIDNPQGHLAFPGTITLPEKYFVKVVEYAARSFKLHAFKTIVLIGDGGGKFRRWLLSRGETEKQIGSHAGIMDTSVLMAVDPAMVRPENMVPSPHFSPGSRMMAQHRCR